MKNVTSNHFKCFPICDSKVFDDLCISAFKLIDESKDIIDLTYPFYEVFIRVLDSKKFHEEYELNNNGSDIKYLFKNLSFYPIRVAVSVKCEEKNRTFKSEYVISQLLMNCLDNQIIGIAYCSNEISSSCDLPAVNLAIPVIGFNLGDKYGYPKTFLEVTDSINFGYFNRVIDDAKKINNIYNAEGLNRDKAFCYAGPLSTFNKMVEWKDLSYDNFTEYEGSIYYTFDDFILYMKAFKKVL